jgi:hypothetical protein
MEGWADGLLLAMLGDIIDLYKYSVSVLRTSTIIPSLNPRDWDSARERVAASGSGMSLGYDSRPPLQRVYVANVDWFTRKGCEPQATNLEPAFEVRSQFVAPGSTWLCECSCRVQIDAPRETCFSRIIPFLRRCGDRRGCSSGGGTSSCSLFGAHHVSAFVRGAESIHG